MSGINTWEYKIPNILLTIKIKRQYYMATFMSNKLQVEQKGYTGKHVNIPTTFSCPDEAMKRKGLCHIRVFSCIPF